MSVIHLLPDSLINKIAAGEVVERPASVVKELLENAIDAGAKNIIIEVTDGGKKSILVRDDGSGIEGEDLLMAVSRHATSKIHTTDDLFAIQTLGFRGEALASIASISKLTLTSRATLASSANEIQIEGGKIIAEKVSPHPIGTTVLVKYLFYQTPARLKFLKSAETESTHIVDHVYRVALANPNRAIRLFHNGNKMVSTESSTDGNKKIADLFGADVAKSCFKIVERTGCGAIAVSGYLGHPQISRSHQRHIYFFVNGRAVKDKIMTHAVMEAHRDALMRGRYPFVVLNLTVPSEMVDVNVHPTKAEVRFSNSSLIHQAVTEAVRKTLESKPWENIPLLCKEGLGEVDRGLSVMTTSVLPHPASPYKGEEVYYSSQQFSLDSQTSQESLVSKSFVNKCYTTTPFSRLNVIGQLMGTYLLCEAHIENADKRFVLIDQHAAHERIGFEKLLKQYEQGNLSTQSLLVPETFDLKPSEAEILKKYLEELQSFGFEIEFFGGCTFVLKGVPAWIDRKGVIKDMMLDLIGDVLEKGKLTSLKDSLHAVLASVSCHGAIRANHHLNLEEMRGLISELTQYPTITTCPHGRPVAIEISSGELERWFKRKV